MRVDRRGVLALCGYGLAAGLLPARHALAAEIKSLQLVEPLGPLSMTLEAFDLLRPVLQKELNCEVVIRTVPGNDGFDAIAAILAPAAGEPMVVSTALLGPQHLERLVPQRTRLETLTPIVKLTNGYSVTLFTKHDGPLKTWLDLAALKPLTVSSLERGTSAFVAARLLERKSGLPVEVTTHNAIPAIAEDVTSGRCAAGIVATNFVFQRLDKFQPIVSFGAARNGMLGQTPTFAEVTGDQKLAFTESIGIFASPKLDPSVAAVLSRAFLAAGQDRAVIDGAEAAELPLAIASPEILVETMKRNGRVLEELLG